MRELIDRIDKMSLRGAVRPVQRKPPWEVGRKTWQGAVHELRSEIERHFVLEKGRGCGAQGERGSGKANERELDQVVHNDNGTYLLISLARSLSFTIT